MQTSQCSWWCHELWTWCGRDCHIIKAYTQFSLKCLKKLVVWNGHQVRLTESPFLKIYSHFGGAAYVGLSPSDPIFLWKIDSSHSATPCFLFACLFICLFFFDMSPESNNLLIFLISTANWLFQMILCTEVAYMTREWLSLKNQKLHSHPMAQ